MTIQIAETIPNTGVDAKEKWLMVPAHGYTWFTLRNAQGLTVRRTSGSVSVHKFAEARGRVLDRALNETWAAAMRYRSPWYLTHVFGLIRQAQTKRDDVYFVKGSGAGAARLEVRKGSGVAGSIDVSVHRRRKVKMALHRVQHRPVRGGPPAPHSPLTLAQLKHIARVAADIITPQTNVEIEQKVDDLAYPGDLGESLDYSRVPGDKQGKEYSDLVEQGQKKAGSAKIHAYAVDSYRDWHDAQKQALGSKHTQNIHPWNIIFNTHYRGFDTTRLGQILAHELAHALMHPRGRIPRHADRGLLSRKGIDVGVSQQTHQDLKIRRERAEAIYRRSG